MTTMGLDAAGDIFLLNQSTLAELSPAGSVDSGVTPATITVSSQGGVAAFQAMGQYLLATTVSVVRGDTDVQVQRFTLSGSPDPTFSSPTIDYTTQEARDSAHAVAIHPDGQIVAAGARFFGTSVFSMARVKANGSLDTSFGTGGVLTTSFVGNEA